VLKKRHFQPIGIAYFGSAPAAMATLEELHEIGVVDELFALFLRFFPNIHTIAK